MNISIRSISLSSSLLVLSWSIHAAGIEIKEVPVTEVAPAVQRSTVSRSFPADGNVQRFSALVTIDGSSMGRTAYIRSSGFDTFYEVLPFDWHVLSDKPLLHVLPEFVEYSSTQEIEFLDLLRIFNIEVLVPPALEFEHPTETILVFEIRSPEKAIQVDLPMYLDRSQSSYYIADPIQVEREISLEVERFEMPSDQPDLEKPWISIRELKGFGLVDKTDETGDQRLLPVAYKLRFGSFSVDSGFQKLGATDSHLSEFPYKPLLTE